MSLPVMERPGALRLDFGKIHFKRIPNESKDRGMQFAAVSFPVSEDSNSGSKSGIFTDLRRFGRKLHSANIGMHSSGKKFKDSDDREMQFAAVCLKVGEDSDSEQK